MNGDLLSLMRPSMRIMATDTVIHLLYTCNIDYVSYMVTKAVALCSVIKADEYRSSIECSR